VAQDTTLHVKVESSIAEGLKALARRRKQTVAELIRRAIGICYQPDLLGLTDTQRQALEEYRGGYISLGKLAEAMGLTAADTRLWLNEHEIRQNICFAGGDTENA